MIAQKIHISQVADVRLQSLLALEPLYATREFGPHLELFTQRFKVCILFVIAC